MVVVTLGGWVGSGGDVDPVETPVHGKKRTNQDDKKNKTSQDVVKIGPDITTGKGRVGQE